MNVDFEGKRFEVVHVVDPDVLVVSIAGEVQGCAEILNGALVANVAADGSAIISARTVADVARCAGDGVGFPVA
jgi:hypothetical protein